jgi:carbamoyl-phosphate synthase large subunit
MARVLLTGGGSGAANSLLRDLRAGDPTIAAVACASDPFALKKSPADRNYLVDPADHPGYLAGLRRIVARERIDLVIPTSDGDIRALARARAPLEARVFLPAAETVEICQDKYDLACRLRAGGVAAPATHPVATLADVDRAFEALPGPPLWCRVRGGAGSSAAAPVVTAEQARWWIMYWSELRGVPVASFALSEYLPGRDFFAQALWKDGELVVIKTCERLSHFVVGGAPSGVSSASRLAKTVCDPRVVETCTAALRALDPAPTGTFNFDLREDAAGVPSITEINAGRFPAGAGLLNLTGKHNLALLYVRLGLDEPVALRGEYDSAEGYYALRDLDALPAVFHEDEVFTDLEDARDEA